MIIRMMTLVLVIALFEGDNENDDNDDDDDDYYDDCNQDNDHVGDFDPVFGIDRSEANVQRHSCAMRTTCSC